MAQEMQAPVPNPSGLALRPYRGERRKPLSQPQPGSDYRLIDGGGLTKIVRDSIARLTSFLTWGYALQGQTPARVWPMRCYSESDGLRGRPPARVLRFAASSRKYSEPRLAIAEPPLRPSAFAAGD